MQRIVERMIKTHPERPVIADDVMAECIHAVVECEQSSIACADASLAESDVAELIHCIRLCQDTADICGTTARILSRHAPAPDLALLATQLEAAAVAADACEAECSRHAAYHMHCQVCAATCRRASSATRALLRAATHEVH